MTVDEAIKELENIRKFHGGSIKLSIYTQTGADSWEWKEVIDMTPFLANKGPVQVEVEF